MYTVFSRTLIIVLNHQQIHAFDTNKILFWFAMLLWISRGHCIYCSSRIWDAVQTLGCFDAYLQSSWHVVTLYYLVDPGTCDILCNHKTSLSFLNQCRVCKEPIHSELLLAEWYYVKHGTAAMHVWKLDFLCRGWHWVSANAKSWDGRLACFHGAKLWDSVHVLHHHLQGGH